VLKKPKLEGLQSEICVGAEGCLGHPQAYGLDHLTRVNSTNVLDEGLGIGGRGRRMNSKVEESNKA
jgi:hypothetical protein